MLDHTPAQPIPPLVSTATLSESQVERLRHALKGVLFLHNNLHLVHHRQPTLAWYRIPGRFRAARDELVASNGGFYYRGYGEIARRFMFRPVFDSAHPKW